MSSSSLSGVKRKRPKVITTEDVINCFYEQQDVTAGLDELAELVEELENDEKTCLLLSPELVARLSICLYWMMHMRGIISFSSFLDNVNSSDMINMLQPLQYDSKDEVNRELFDGIVMFLFNELGSTSLVELSVLDDTIQSKYLHILMHICFPPSLMSSKSSEVDPESSPPAIILKSRDIYRLRHINEIFSAVHNKLKIEAWHILLARCLFFCDINFDENYLNDCNAEGDNLLIPLSGLLNTLPSAAIIQALNSSLQVQMQAGAKFNSNILLVDVTSNCSSRIMHCVDNISPLDDEKLFCPPVSLNCSFLRLLLIPVHPSTSPYISHSVVLQSASSISLSGVREGQTSMFLRGFRLVSLLSTSVEYEQRVTLNQWLQDLILGSDNSHTSQHSSVDRTVVESHNSCLSQKEFQFLCFTLCSALSNFSEKVLRETGAVLRLPTIRKMDPDHESVDMFLQLSRARLREFQENSLQLQGNSARLGNKKGPLSLMQSLTNSKENKNDTAKPAKIPEVTVARIQSWAATFRRAGELPVSVSQLCHLLAQSCNRTKGIGSRVNQEPNLVLRTESYRLLFDCMEDMIHEDNLSVSTSVSPPRNYQSSGNTPKKVLLSLSEACKVVATGMSKCTPPLCPLAASAAFIDKVDRMLRNKIEGDENCDDAEGGEQYSDRRMVLSGVNYVIPSSKVLNSEGKNSVNKCRKSVEAALLFVASLRRYVKSLTLPHLVRTDAAYDVSFSFIDCGDCAVRDCIADSDPGSTPRVDIEEWLSDTFLLNVRNRWSTAVDNVLIDCSTLEAIVMRRFIGFVALQVFQTLHEICQRVCHLYGALKMLQNPHESHLMRSCCTAVLKLFELAAILTSIYKDPCGVSVEIAFSLMTKGWALNRTSGHSANDIADSGCNALFFYSLDEEVRSHLIHNASLYVLSHINTAGASMSSMILTLRRLVQLKSIKDQCLNMGRNSSASFIDCPRTEESAMVSQPFISTCFLFLLSSSKVNLLEGDFDLICSKIYDVLDNIFQEFTQEDKDSKNKSSLEHHKFRLSKLCQFLRCTDCVRLFAWEYASQSGGIKGEMSHQERKNMLCRLCLHLFVATNSLGDIPGSFSYGDIAMSLGDSVVNLVGKVLVQEANINDSKNNCNFNQLSGAVMDFIETVVSVIIQAFSLLSGSFFDTSGADIFSSWFQRVWKEATKGIALHHQSNLGKANLRSSPSSVSTICDSPDQNDLTAVPYLQKLEIACVWVVLKMMNESALAEKNGSNTPSETTSFSSYFRDFQLILNKFRCAPGNRLLE